jgi:hypothetical protein
MTLRVAVVAAIAVVAAGCGESRSGASPTAPSVLTTFASGRWDLRMDRVWDGVAGNVQFPSDQFDESAYKPVSGASTYRVVVSTGGQQVAIGESPVRGQRTKATHWLVEYALSAGTNEAPAGGRLVVWPGSGGLQAELTFYGSGRPIIKSERGTIVLVE